MKKTLKILEEEILVQSGEQGVQFTLPGRLLGRTGFHSASMSKLQPGPVLDNTTEKLIWRLESLLVIYEESDYCFAY